MAKCNWCKKNMSSNSVKTCTGNIVVEFPDGKTMASVPYVNEYRPEPHRCHDCNVEVGGKHHPGCDMERCPVCAGQLISCEHGADPEDS